MEQDGSGPAVVENTPTASMADIACYEDNVDQTSLDAGHTRSLRDKFTAFEDAAGRVQTGDSGDRVAAEIAAGAIAQVGGGVYENSPSMRCADIVREDDQDTTEASIELQTRQMKNMWSSKENEPDQSRKTTPSQVVDLTDFDLTLTGDMRRNQNKSASDNRRRTEQRWQVKRDDREDEDKEVKEVKEDNGKEVNGKEVKATVNCGNARSKWEENRLKASTEKHSSCQSINPAADIALMRQLDLENRSPSPEPVKKPETKAKSTNCNQFKKNVSNKWNGVQQETEVAKPNTTPKTNGKSTQQRWADMRQSELKREADSVSSLRISSREISDIRKKGIQPEEVEKVEPPKPVVAEPEPFVDSFHERRRRRNLASRQPIVRKKKEPSPPKVVVPELSKTEKIVLNRRSAEEKWLALRKKEEDIRKDEVNSFKSYTAPPEPVLEPEPEIPKPKPQRTYGGGNRGFGNCYQSEKRLKEEEEARAVAIAKALAIQEANKPKIELDSDGEPIVDKWSNIGNLWGGSSSKKAIKKQPSIDSKNVPKTPTKPTSQNLDNQASLPNVVNADDQKRFFRFRDNWNRK